MASVIRNFRQRRQSRRQHALERLLRQHDAQLNACKRALRDDLPAVPAAVSDEMEQSVDHLARAVEAAVVEVSSSAVRGIENALRRLKSGHYGRCSDCGGRIAAARLRVLPFAERCRECQSACDSPVAAQVFPFSEVCPS
jgi:RNA polymerase-binding transcription factor DksA